MIDCFITTNKKRPYFLSLTERALTLSGFLPTIINEPLLYRYFECERQAKTDIYILSDDDVIPATQNTLRNLIEIMEAHPEYSQLGLGWKHDMTSEAGSPWIRGKESDVWEMDHIGGLMAIRKGTIKDLGHKAEFTSGYGDDRVMGKTARDLGYKVGLVPTLYFHNLGFNYTTFTGI